ncbi:hypothetical protein MRX96_043204 [Rhipicephalus microplus]
MKIFQVPRARNEACFAVRPFRRVIVYTTFCAVTRSRPASRSQGAGCRNPFDLFQRSRARHARRVNDPVSLIGEASSFGRELRPPRKRTENRCQQLSGADSARSKAYARCL